VSYGNPYYLVLDGNGNIFFTDLAGSLIRKISPQGVVTTIYTAGASGNGIYGLALDNAGNFYTVDEFDNQIDKINSGSLLSVFAGNGNIIGGANDGTGNGASFYQPWGLTIDGNGNLFVLDRGNGLIRKITPAAVVTTFGGQDPTSFSGPLTKANLQGLTGIAADASGNIYVAGSNVIRKISAQ
jgi:streptogramin lyase